MENGGGGNWNWWRQLEQLILVVEVVGGDGTMDAGGAGGSGIVIVRGPSAVNFGSFTWNKFNFNSPWWR